MSKPARRLLPVRHGAEGEFQLPNASGCVSFEKCFLNNDEAQRIFEDCLHAKSWNRSPIVFFGKSVMQPRDTAFFGTHFYSYSGERRMPTGWNEDAPAGPTILRLANKIEKHLGKPVGWFNVVLANKYMHGQDSMGYHADDEASLGSTPLIASVSLGTSRKFVIRPKKTLTLEDPFKLEYHLTNGSLLVMSGPMQQWWEHCVPKVALSKCDAVRINLTFRHVITNPDGST